MNALQYTRELVAFPTVSSSSNAAICVYLEQVLKKLGFETERIEYVDSSGVDQVNVVGKKGIGTGGMAYFGHTDVVPADSWFSSEHGPFEPTVRGDKLYGRGGCDMKGSIGAMLAAVEDVGDVDLRLADEIRRGPIRQDCSLGHSGSPAPRLACSVDIAGSCTLCVPRCSSHASFLGRARLISMSPHSHPWPWWRPPRDLIEHPSRDTQSASTVGPELP